MTQVLLESYGVRAPETLEDGEEVALRTANDRPLPESLLKQYAANGDEKEFVRLHQSILQEGTYDGMRRTLRLIFRIWSKFPLWLNLAIAMGAFMFVPVFLLAGYRMLQEPVALAKIVMLFAFSAVVTICYVMVPM